MMSETELPESETELETPIKVRWTGYTRERIYGYNLDFQTEKSDRVARAMNRQKTNVVIKSVEEARAMVAELTNYYGNEFKSRVWMNASAGSAVDRVRDAVIDEMGERGFAVESRHSVSVEFSEDADEDSEDDTMTPAEQFASDVREVIAEHGAAEVFDGMNTHTLTDADEIQVSDGFLSLDGSAFSVTDAAEVTAPEQSDSEDSDDDRIGPLFTDSGEGDA